MDLRRVVSVAFLVVCILGVLAVLMGLAELSSPSTGGQHIFPYTVIRLNENYFWLDIYFH